MIAFQRTPSLTDRKQTQQITRMPRVRKTGGHAAYVLPNDIVVSNHNLEQVFSLQTAEVTANSKKVRWILRFHSGREAYADQVRFATAQEIESRRVSPAS